MNLKINKDFQPNYDNLLEISIKDILGREPIKYNSNEIAGFLKGKVILVTGAGGSIGSEICRQISDFNPKKLILLGHGENSIFNIEKVFK